MDNWYFSRKSLAEHYLKIFDVGISSNLAIIAPRRKGKTLFILKDICDAAKKKKYFTVYSSLWQNINAPHEGIIASLEDAIHAIDSKRPIARLLNTEITKASLGNELIGKVELEFADCPQTPRNSDLATIDKLLSKLQNKVKNKKILLLIDEVQHLATSSKFDSLTHSLRTSLDKRQGKIKAIFTGSSRHYMNLLFSLSKSPFYQFAETVPFPELSYDFIEFLTKKLEKRHRINIDNVQLHSVFKAVDQSPYWMMKIISYMITFEASLSTSEDYILNLINAADRFEETANKLKKIDKLVFLALSHGKNPFSKEVLSKVDQDTDIKGVAPNIQRSLKRLIDRQLISQVDKGQYNM